MLPIFPLEKCVGSSHSSLIRKKAMHPWLVETDLKNMTLLSYICNKASTGNDVLIWVSYLISHYNVSYLCEISIITGVYDLCNSFS